MSNANVTIKIEDLVIDAEFHYEKEDNSVGFSACVSEVELTMDFNKQTNTNQKHITDLIHEEMERLITGGKHG